MIRYAIALILVLVGYLYLGNYQAIIDYKQQALIADTLAQGPSEPKDRADYFQLAQGYIYQNQFQLAQQIYDYLLFAEGEKADTLAAKATTQYYANQQRINPEVEQLLQRALELEPLQITATMLLAADHFNQARYQSAIDLWQKLLDSQQPGLDRVTLINAIHISRLMLNHHYPQPE